MIQGDENQYSIRTNQSMLVKTNIQNQSN